MENDKQLKNLQGKIQALSTILKLGHEAFEKADLSELSLHIVNNSHIIAEYDGASFVDMRTWPRVLSQLGLPEVNDNSEYNNYLVNLLRPFRELNHPLIVNHEELEQRKALKGAFESLAYFEDHDAMIFLIPLRPQYPGAAPSEELFIWFIEFRGRKKDKIKQLSGILTLLSKHFCEALGTLLAPKQRNLRLWKKKPFSPRKAVAVIITVFFLSLFIVRLRQNVAAEFEIVPVNENIVYAPFDGVIKKSYFKNGKRVQPGDLILAYDTEVLLFKLADAQKAYEEAAAELDLAQRQSFNDPQKRGSVRLLELKKAKALIDVKRKNWFLSKSALKSNTSGLLAIEDQKKLEGKAVHSGEKLFEILSSTDLMAEVMLDEQNASVLNKDTTVWLYLHTRPERPIKARILTVSPRPVLNERRRYCYVISVSFEGEIPSGLICGMRGVARVSGPRVSLGYYLFRNLLLWWRKV